MEQTSNIWCKLRAQGISLPLGVAEHGLFGAEQPGVEELAQIPSGNPFGHADEVRACYGVALLGLAPRAQQAKKVLSPSSSRSVCSVMAPRR